jgi:hypothetical protein
MARAPFRVIELRDAGYWIPPEHKIVCPFCGAQPPEYFETMADAREHLISGICERCWRNTVTPCEDQRIVCFHENVLPNGKSVCEHTENYGNKCLGVNHDSCPKKEN